MAQYPQYQGYGFYLRFKVCLFSRNIKFQKNHFYHQNFFKPHLTPMTRSPFSSNFLIKIHTFYHVFIQRIWWYCLEYRVFDLVHKSWLTTCEVKAIYFVWKKIMLEWINDEGNKTLHRDSELWAAEGGGEGNIHQQLLQFSWHQTY